MKFNKKSVFSLILLLLSLNLYAGNYDGVWVVKNEKINQFVSIHQNGDQLLFIGLWEEMDGWSALLGQTSGDQAEVFTIVSPDDENQRILIQFTSSTEGTVTMLSCNCDIPLNVPASFRKVF